MGICQGRGRQKEMTINQWVKRIHRWAKIKGWLDVKRSAPECHMLMVTEIAEATEEVRKKSPPVYGDVKPEGEAIELADCVIRIMEYFGKNGWNLEEALRLKMAYNDSRPYRHGNKRY